VFCAFFGKVFSNLSEKSRKKLENNNRRTYGGVSQYIYNTKQIMIYAYCFVIYYISKLLTLSHT